MFSESLQQLFLILIICNDIINSDVVATNDLTEFSSNVKPNTSITNITFQIGENAYLPCKEKKIFNKSISWVRVRDDHILTVDQITFITDQRFQAFDSSSTGYQSGSVTLQIKYVQARDAGIYECQVSSEPKISARVYLNVIVPRTEIIGKSIRYVTKGSKVYLHCAVIGAIEPPLYIIWYLGNQQIFPDNQRGWSAIIDRNNTEEGRNRSTIGTLLIPSITKRDSGNYTCSPSNSESVSIYLHVINGEYSASAITSSSTKHLHIFNGSKILTILSTLLIVYYQT